MNNPPGFEASSTLSPDEAFAVLGDETRLAILQILGEAEGPLSFSELFARVDYDTTANFSYHLEKVGGHFVRKGEEGYELQNAGQRVVEAVLSGAMTDVPVLERTQVDIDCPLCGAPTEVSYRHEDVGFYCPACGGTRSAASDTAAWADVSADDILGHVELPPAGVHDRTPEEVVEAAEVWTVTEAWATARGVCPRCSAPVDHAVQVCDAHDTSGDRCDECNQQFGTSIRAECTNCIFARESVFTKYLLADPNLVTFMIDHDVDPVAPEGFHVFALEETIRSVDPFEGEFTFTADDESITLTVNGDLTVSDVERRPVSKPGGE